MVRKYAMRGMPVNTEASAGAWLRVNSIGRFAGRPPLPAADDSAKTESTGSLGSTPTLAEIARHRTEVEAIRAQDLLNRQLSKRLQDAETRLLHEVGAAKDRTSAAEAQTRRALAEVDSIAEELETAKALIQEREATIEQLGARIKGLRGTIPAIGTRINEGIIALWGQLPEEAARQALAKVSSLVNEVVRAAEEGATR
jgi:chromosome segregation ATPase